MVGGRPGKMPVPIFEKYGDKNMSDLLKGNFETKKKVVNTVEKETLEGRFERETMKSLGGSVAFVAKQKVKWDTDQDT
jgi:hypothetical protein